MSVTTTRGGFRVEDITFHGARKQSVSSVPVETSEQGVAVPISLTPESVKNYLRNKPCSDEEKRVYTQVCEWIDELMSIRKDNLRLAEKLEAHERVNKEDTGDSID